MKTNNIVTKGSLIVFIAILFSATSIAQQHGKGKGTCNNANYTCERGIPDLTDEQQQKIADLRVEHRAKMLALKADVNVLRAELHKLEIADQPDVNSIDKKIEELGALKIQMAKEKSKHRLEVRSLLTKEQRVMFDSRKGNCRGQCKR